jgi:hypothetical protein
MIQHAVHLPTPNTSELLPHLPLEVLNQFTAMDFNGSSPFPEGVISFLDTDLYKLTMQCAVLKYFPDVKVTYAFKNRTPEKKLSRAAFRWLQNQINSHSPPASCPRNISS